MALARGPVQLAQAGSSYGRKEAIALIGTGSPGKGETMIDRFAVFCCFAVSLSAQVVTTQYPQPPAVVIEPLILKPSGSFPQKLIRPVGPFVLYVENWLPQKAVHFTLSLDSASETELIGGDTTQTINKTTFLLDLKPGKYHLIIPGNSTWSLPIQITAK